MVQHVLDRGLSNNLKPERPLEKNQVYPDLCSVFGNHQCNLVGFFESVCGAFTKGLPCKRERLNQHPVWLSSLGAALLLKHLALLPLLSLGPWAPGEIENKTAADFKRRGALWIAFKLGSIGKHTEKSCAYQKAQRRFTGLVH